MAHCRESIKIFIMCLLICVAGCSSNLYKQAEQPIMISPPEVAKKPSPGTIWPGENARNSLFIDRKARRVNDILTIVVSESAEGGNNASTDTSRDTSTTAGITSMLGLEQKILEQNEHQRHSDEDRHVRLPCGAVELKAVVPERVFEQGAEDYGGNQHEQEQFFDCGAYQARRLGLPEQPAGQRVRRAEPESEIRGDGQNAE